MTTTVRQLVDQVRSVLQGSLSDELSVLDQDYAVTDGKIVLRYPKKNLQPGTLLSCGLNTFYALALSADGRTVDVLPSADGGPNTATLHNEIVRIRPRYTTWSIFREWNNELSSMHAPMNGLYAYGSFESVPNWVSGTYNLPTTDNWALIQPIRLLMVRYRQYGRTSWQKVQAAEYQPDGNQVRIYGPQPPGILIEFIFAFPFLPATSLDNDVAPLGLTDYTNDIPGLGALETLSRGGEMRRLQPSSQGDPRRAEELPAGASLGAARDWRAVQQARINEELTRLQAQFGYQVVASQAVSVISGGVTEGAGDLR